MTDKKKKRSFFSRIISTFFAFFGLDFLLIACPVPMYAGLLPPETSLKISGYVKNKNDGSLITNIRVRLLWDNSVIAEDYSNPSYYIGYIGKTYADTGYYILIADDTDGSSNDGVFAFATNVVYVSTIPLSTNIDFDL